ncbi:MAG: M48 family metallopeptidase [Lentisphaerae bacterium]|nr:M48 family metallopeptidase [Lentisphaerota bacterium]
MDFFQSQDRAKQRTNLLIGLYALAVVLLILAIYFLFAFFFATQSDSRISNSFFRRWWDPELFYPVTIGTLLFIVGGSLHKIVALAGDGEKLAKLLGGRKINSNTNVADEKKILNVVEEMALASGIHVPPVYLLDGERGINAFAAGFRPDNAVIGITRGAISSLSRDELQGVIAHEFSHIFNGDMRLNIRLMGVLHGILVIALTGYWVMRHSFSALSVLISPSDSESSENKGCIMVFVFLFFAWLAFFGLLVMVIGYIGVLIAKLIKSAVSRQREFLADAAAVQFTRNPAGISGALKKIDGYEFGSNMETRHKEEASHFFFANALALSFFGLVSTHPHLEERIRRLDSGYTAKLKPGTLQKPELPDESVPGVVVCSSGIESVMSSIGAPSLVHLQMASEMLSDLPEYLDRSAREVQSAQWLVYALLLSDEPEIRHCQLRMIETYATGTAGEEVARLYPFVTGLDERLRLPLVEIAISTLRNMEKPEYECFKGLVEELEQADNEIDFFEYMLNRMIIRYLAANLGEGVLYREKYFELSDVSDYFIKVILCLANWGADSREMAEAVFKKVIAHVELSVPVAEISFDDCSLDMLDNSLSELAMSSMKLKKKIVDACVVCVLGDGQVTVDESHTLRAIGDYLGCPIPPLVTEGVS